MATRILVIDDDEAVLEFLRLKLGRDFTVETLTDARKAVEAATAQRPDVVLCDIDMPHMNGGEVAAALQKVAALAGIPVVFMTNVLSPSEVQGLGGVVGGHRSISKRAPIADLIAGIRASLAPATRG